jgi:hypothetical protein
MWLSVAGAKTGCQSGSVEFPLSFKWAASFGETEGDILYFL